VGIYKRKVCSKIEGNGSVLQQQEMPMDVEPFASKRLNHKLLPLACKPASIQYNF
jgi:hypothetical protein